MAQPFKHPDTGIYYLRRKVPPELRSFLGREYKRSLNTREPTEAKALFAEQWAKSESAFATARVQLNGVTVMSVPDIQAFAAHWYQAELAKMEATGDFSRWIADGPTTGWESGHAWGEHTPKISLRDGLNDNPDFDLSAEVSKLAHTALRAKDIPMPKAGTPTYEALINIFKEHCKQLAIPS